MQALDSLFNKIDPMLIILRVNFFFFALFELRSLTHKRLIYSVHWIFQFYGQIT